MNPRGWRWKWLHQVAWAFARTICLSCSHLQIDVQGTSAVAFCSPLQLVVAGCAPDFCCCAHPEFRYRQSAQNFASHKRAGSCSRHRAAETCERGPKGPGCSCLIMCARQKPEMWGVCHESRSAVHMFAGQWSLPLSSRCTDTIRPSVLVRLSCRLCRLVFSCSAQCLRCSVRGHDYLQAAWIGCGHSVAPTYSILFHIDCLARVQQTRFSPNIPAEPVALCPTCWICVDGEVFQSFSCGMIQPATAQNCFVK